MQMLYAKASEFIYEVGRASWANTESALAKYPYIVAVQDSIQRGTCAFTFHPMPPNDLLAIMIGSSIGEYNPRGRCSQTTFEPVWSLELYALRRIVILSCCCSRLSLRLC